MVPTTQPTMAANSLARMLKGQVRCYSAPLDLAIPASKQRYIPTRWYLPQGFLVSGTHVGVKASNTRFPDLALIASETPCSAAAVFTTNKFQAAPVQVSPTDIAKSQGRGHPGCCDQLWLCECRDRQGWPRRCRAVGPESGRVQRRRERQLAGDEYRCYWTTVSEMLAGAVYCYRDMLMVLTTP